jgi:uncharacterized protein YdeI (YjbR/CyaY-like superfamily)
MKLSEDPIYFGSPAEFRAWLEKNHATAPDVWVGYYKRATGRPSLTWAGSVDQALCFGWIDGIRKSIDDARYVIRFTPRKATSKWSLVNVRRMKELARLGLMTLAGQAAFDKRGKAKADYSYEQRHESRFTAAQARALRADKTAWAFLSAQPPGYQHTVAFWVTSAKKEDTQARRLSQLIECCRKGERVGLLQRPAKKK